MSFQAPPTVDIFRKYPLETFKEIGFKDEKEAKKNGFSYDKKGNLIYCFRSLETSLPILNSTPTNQRAVKHSKGSKTSRVEPIFEPVISTRFNPYWISYHAQKGEKLDKYKFPKGYNLIYWSNTVLVAYNNKTKGIRLVVQEGAKKAASMSLNGFNALAPNGIHNYKLTNELKDLIKTLKVNRIDICYDADFSDVSDKGKIISDKRPRGFGLSALRFASQIFEFIKDENQPTFLLINALKKELKENGTTSKELQGEILRLQGEILRCSVYFSAIQDNHEAKGIDDLFYKYRLLGRENEVIGAFEEGKTNDFFIFKRLSKTTAKDKIFDLIGLDNHSAFYKKHKKSIDKKNGRFLFNGVEYKRSKNGRFHIIQSNKIEIDRTIIEVQKHLSSLPNTPLSEAENQIFSLLKINQKISIDAPTGGGKTTALINLFAPIIKEIGLKIVFCCPTQLLTESIYKDALSLYRNSVAILTGERKTPNYFDKNIIICTYDQLQRVNDLEQRLMVIDESHNIVSAFNYRKRAVQFFQQAFSIAAKTVLLSGTPNDLMTNIFDFKAIKIKQKEAQQITVFDYENSDYIAELVQILGYKNNIDSNSIDVVLLNDKKKLEAIKGILLNLFNLNNDEIVLLTSDKKNNLNSSSKAVFDSISRKKAIPNGVKLILSTCIIAEGVSIDNRNINKVITISTRQSFLDVETIKQFSARFRKLNKVDIHCILPTETALKSDYTKCQHKVAIDRIKHAEIEINSQIEAFQDHIQKYGIDTNYDEKFLNHSDNNTLLKYLYELNYGSFHIDKLYILSDIQNKKNRLRNNVALMSELGKFENVTISDGLPINELNEGEKESLQEDLKEEKANYNERKKKAIENAKNYLLDERTEKIFIESLYFSKKTTNRDLTKYLEEFYFGQKVAFQSLAVQEFSVKNIELLESNFCNDIVKAFVFLKLTISDSNFINNQILNFNKTAFKKVKRRILMMFQISVYNSKKTRNLLSNLQKLELRKVAKIEQSLTLDIDDIFYSSPLYNYKKRINKKSVYNIDKHCHKLDIKQILKTLELFFEFKMIRTASTDYIYKEFKSLEPQNLEIKKMLKIDENIYNVLKINNY